MKRWLELARRESVLSSEDAELLGAVAAPVAGEFVELPPDVIERTQLQLRVEDSPSVNGGGGARPRLGVARRSRRRSWPRDRPWEKESSGLCMAIAPFAGGRSTRRPPVSHLSLLLPALHWASRWSGLAATHRCRLAATRKQRSPAGAQRRYRRTAARSPPRCVMRSSLRRRGQIFRFRSRGPCPGRIPVRQHGSFERRCSRRLAADARDSPSHGVGST